MKKSGKQDERKQRGQPPSLKKKQQAKNAKAEAKGKPNVEPDVSKVSTTNLKDRNWNPYWKFSMERLVRKQMLEYLEAANAEESRRMTAEYASGRMIMPIYRIIVPDDDKMDQLNELIRLKGADEDNEDF